MKWLEIIYQYFWYYTEWWIKKTYLRRPFTFIMRDHPWAFWGILTSILGIAAYFSPVWLRFILGIFWGMLLSHLWWGAKVIPNEQETPTFDPLHPVKSINLIRAERQKRL